MDISTIHNDIVVIEFFDMMQFSKATEKNYIAALKNYSNYMNKTPSDWVEDARQDIRSGRMPSERMVRRQVLGFRKHMYDNHMAPLSIKARLSCIVSFYKFFDVEVPTLPRSKAKARTLEGNDRIPTTEELREVLKVCNPLETAMVLVGASSGLSSNELRRLTVGQFKAGYDKETGITTIDMRRAKSGVDFITFMSPEASRAVWDYINYRNRPCTSRFRHVKEQQGKQRITSDDDYLFAKERIPVEYLDTQDEDMRQHTPQSIMVLYQRLSGKSGLVVRDARNVIRAHNLRKYFNSALLNAGCDSFHVEYWMGHALDMTRSAYFRASPDKMKDLYMRYVPALTIQESIDVESSERYKELVAQNEVLEANNVRANRSNDMTWMVVDDLKGQVADQRKRADEFEKKLMEIMIGIQVEKYGKNK